MSEGGGGEYEGSTIERSRVILQGRQDPAATLLFVTDKDTLIHTIILPSHSLYLFFFLSSYLFLFACLLPPSCCLRLCHATMKRVWAPQPPRGAVEELQIRNRRLCMFVCLFFLWGARPCGLFKSLSERRGS